VSKYKILEMDDLVELENLVNEYMREGWRPLGGICFAINPPMCSAHPMLYAQAIIKIDRKD